jgi:type II secretory ATPase GspE/PulE/Tfp pilus assembly ATPase PilB-like protein
MAFGAKKAATDNRRQRREALQGHVSHKDPCDSLDAGQAEDVKPDTASPYHESLETWARSLGIPILDDLRGRAVPPIFVERIPIRFARQHGVVALVPSNPDDQNGVLEVALSSPVNWDVLDVVRRHIGRDITPVFAAEDRILTAINAAYQCRDGQANTAVSQLSPESSSSGTMTIQEDLLDGINQPPVIRLVNSVLYEAIQARASDVHVQPQEEDVVVRQRIDGVLFDTLQIPKAHQEEVISRLKILGR